MKKVLIANRGEIAVRIAHTCAEAGVESVAVFADPDAEALHVRVADEAYSLEGEELADTYLNAEKILAIAERTEADAVHPGYGFLAERADFAQAVLDAGLTWIGPDPKTISMLGDKVVARRIAEKAGAPLVDGSDGNVSDSREARRIAEDLGLPIAIKAVHGGGGRGMRVVHQVEDVEEAFESAVRESQAAFGRSECYIEKFLIKPRHVEVQVIADTHDNVFVLGTRDCSLQRRNQKLVEEAPAPFLTEEQKDLVVSSARDICRAAGYVGVGTVEYMLGASGELSFLEVNPRIQVEHTVTEAVTGIDMVLAQLQIADGQSVPLDGDVEPTGHAFQFRLNAEDVGRGFLPATGTIDVLDPPTGPGIRIDTGVHAGSVISGRYDSMLAKIIVSGISRKHAIRRARRALRELRIFGIATVLPFHRAILEDEAFISEERLGVYTTWIEDEFSTRISADPQFRQAMPSQERVRLMIEIDGKNAKLGLPAAFIRALTAGGDGGVSIATLSDSSESKATTDPAELRAPMAGHVLSVMKAEGDTVAEDEPILVLEAMKTETPVPAHRSGTITELVVVEGDRVEVDQVLARIQAKE